MGRESGQPYAAIFTFAPSLALVTLVMAKPPPPPIPKLTVNCAGLPREVARMKLKVSVCVWWGA